MTRNQSKQPMLYDLGAVPVIADALDPDQVAEAVARAMRVPRFVGRLFAGETSVMIMTEIRGASNAKAKRDLGWQPKRASWRQEFAAA